MYWTAGLVLGAWILAGAFVGWLIALNLRGLK